MHARLASNSALPRAVEIVRVSTQGQARKDSPEDQRRALDALREARPCTVVERIDFQVSGTTDVERRPDLQRLAQLADARAFDEIRCVRLDRLTRHPDPGQRVYVLSLAWKLKATILDANGSVLDPRTMAGEMQWFLATLSAAEEVDKIKARTSAGKLRRAEAGHLVYKSRPPFARIWADGKWGIDEKLAALYRRMFEMVLNGRSLTQIADALNAEGATTTPGGRWTQKAVSRLLHSPSAYGKHVSMGVTVPVPAVVPEGTWHAVMERLKANNRLSGPKPEYFRLLRKLAVCGRCGAPIRVRRWGHRPANRYICATYLTGHASFNAPDLDAQVIEALRRVLSKPETLERAAKADMPKAQRGEAEAAIRAVRKELAKLDAAEERLARLTVRGLLTEKTGAQQLDELRTLRAAAEERAAAARAALAEGERSAKAGDSLKAVLVGLRRDMRSFPPEAWRILLELMLRRGEALGLSDGAVRLYPDGTFKVSGVIAAGSSLRPGS